jgi:hypothetical protein
MSILFKFSGSSLRVLRSFRARSGLLDWDGSGRHTDRAFSQSASDLLDEVGHLLGNEGIVNDDAQGVKEVLLLSALVLSHDLEVLVSFLEVFSFDGSNIV